MPSAILGDHVWASPSENGEFDVFVGGKVTKIDSKRIRILTDDGKEMWITSDQIQKHMHITSIDGVEDMITLGELQEYSILRNIHLRYMRKLIYTYTGTMLVAMNPYEVLPIYSNTELVEYRERKLGELPPHIFAIGDSSYTEMMENKTNQCIVISGESGAGKTESTKLILQYLAAMSGKHSWIEQQILEANPILEAFGNAKTVRNDNSSRFGKYIDIQFNDSGAIDSASIEQYLLEKSRIVQQSQGERNYHIFYSLLAGLTREEKKRWELGDSAHYAYLNGGGALTCNGRNEASEFSDIRGAMRVLSFSEQEVADTFQILAAILHLGNLKYKSSTVNNLEAAEISDGAGALRVAGLLGTSRQTLVDALTKRTILARGDSVVSPIGKQQAHDVRDAFVKSMYGRLFVMVVSHINAAISRSGQAGRRSIGVLDIFGFENFQRNSFEQLCINYANENLQQFFIRHIFKLEQEFYVAEGIRWQHIQFVDNQGVLDVIGSRPLNMLALIDDESKFPQATDHTLLAKLHATHAASPCYLRPKSDLAAAFSIRHFAGLVKYEVPGFLEKNRDTFSLDIKKLIENSQNQFLRGLFKSELASVVDTGKKATIAAQFRSSLDILMKTLSACHPFFIRCIKPNELKKPGIFDRALCCRQLRYSGMMETARIRRAGYPIRHSFNEFVDRYRYLVPGTRPSHRGDPKASAQKICSVVLGEADWQVGHTKIFLKEAEDNLLEEERSKVLSKYLLVLQSAIRGWLCRRRFLQLRAAALVVQKHWRARGHRSRFLAIRQGYLRLQARLRGRRLRHDFQRVHGSVCLLQARCRGLVFRREFRTKFSWKRAKVQELLEMRRRDETDFRNAGEADYRELARELYAKRFSELEGEQAADLDDKRTETILDDLFNFLKEPATPAEGVKPPFTDEEQGTHELISALEDEQCTEDLSAYNFRKFAATYFQGNVNHQYAKRPLKASLLDLPTATDTVAAQALWVTILRFMGDLPEPRYVTDAQDNKPVMMKITQTLSRRFVNSQQYKDAVREHADGARSQKLISMTLKRKDKLHEHIRRSLLEDEHASQSYQSWLYSRRTSNLEKLHFIIGHGILRAELRDEIYCQICKQLTNNASRTSHARGWVLLSLCVGCFAPTDRFVNYLRAFIREGPPGYAPYCESRLNRTFRNGPRCQPPSWLELQATKSKGPVQLTVMLMDGSRRAVQADSASTAAEVCQQLALHLRLTDTFGFSLFIAMQDKVMSLGSDGTHVLDAVSQCEQYAKEQGAQERNAPWQLFFRKELFAPWHESTADPVATHLIYQQVVRGLKCGEYRCATEGDIAMIIAQQYYVDCGAPLRPGHLHDVIRSYVPTHFLQAGERALAGWEARVAEAFAMSIRVRERAPALQAQEDIVTYAKLSWPILFSKFYEAVRAAGPRLPRDDVIVAVSWTGVFLVDDQEQILLELSFVELLSVGCEARPGPALAQFTLSTLRGEHYVFRSPDAQELSQLLTWLLDELRRRSTYVVALRDYEVDGDSGRLPLRRGDLVQLAAGLTGQRLMSEAWGSGRCGNVVGDFPTDHVYILPALQPPPPQLLEEFKKEDVLDPGRQGVAPTVSTLQRLKMHTLERYAADNFRPGRRLGAHRGASIQAVRHASHEELWKFCSEPLHAPLLRALQADDGLARDACSAFLAVLQYMGDIPTHKPRATTEFTDLVFGKAMRCEPLRDEVYCQLMRQLTHNRLQASEERGWELLWLATGLFLPSPPLLRELTEFLKTRLHPVAQHCELRLGRLQKSRCRRSAPYIIEVEAIQHRSLQIYHKVYFPDDTDEAYEVHSTTKAGDLCADIAARLELKSCDGFSLFVMMADRVFSIPEDCFFFDFIYELIDWMKQTKPNWNTAAPLQVQYQIFFMKKLWINEVPGKDKNADEIFYYPQEVPKYLRGYHKCSKQDAVKLGALVYRIKFEDDATYLQQIPQILKELVPVDLLKAQSSADWRKSITAAYNSNKNITVEEAKQSFLEHVFNWSTFGSAFFEVKQTTDQNYPEVILIAINKNGIVILHPVSKDILGKYAFSELSNWSSGNTFFHMTLGNIMKASKLLCETSLGYKMDDLITSYIEYLRRNRKTKTKNIFDF